MFNNPADSVLCLRNLCIKKTWRTERDGYIGWA